MDINNRLTTDVRYSKFFGLVANACRFDSSVKTATVFLSDRLVIKATRHGKHRRNERSSSLVVTYGAPNYGEREFIQRCKRDGKPLPLQKVQLRHVPKK